MRGGQVKRVALLGEPHAIDKRTGVVAVAQLEVQLAILKENVQ